MRMLRQRVKDTTRRPDWLQGSSRSEMAIEAFMFAAPVHDENDQNDGAVDLKGPPVRFVANQRNQNTPGPQPAMGLAVNAEVGTRTGRAPPKMERIGPCEIVEESGTPILWLRVDNIKAICLAADKEKAI
jgi:hypothetical protein